MTTVSSVALGGLQVIALLSAVIVAGSRLMIVGIGPNSREDSRNSWLAKLIAYGAIISLIMLFSASILFIFGLMGAYGMPPLIDLAFILLLLGLVVFGVPMVLLIYYRMQEGKLPPLEPPR